jgi:hypothetical protein
LGLYWWRAEHGANINVIDDIVVCLYVGIHTKAIYRTGGLLMIVPQRQLEAASREGEVERKEVEGVRGGWWSGLVVLMLVAPGRWGRW